MSFNGSGVFSINTSGQPVVAATVIDPDVFNAFTADIATGLSNCVTKDGQQTVTANIPMAGYKITGLGLGSATTDAARMDNATSYPMDFRLSLNASSPVTSADTIGASTLYCLPYKGNKIALQVGGVWVIRTSAAFSIAIAGLTAYRPYDVFCFDSSGVPTLELLAWTSLTARATDLALQNGIYVKNGEVTRRYIGTVVPTASNTLEDSEEWRFVWNYYNRVIRSMKQTIQGSVPYDYTTAVLRQANANTDNAINFVCGVTEEPVVAYTVMHCYNTVANVAIKSTIGENSTSVEATGVVYETPLVSVVSGINQVEKTKLRKMYYGAYALTLLEHSAASGTTTWGNNATSGIYGEIMG